MARSRSPLHSIGLIALRLCELGLVCLIVAAVVGIALYRYYGDDLPDPAMLATHRPFETTHIFARDGQTLLYELFDSGQRTVISLADIPWSLKAATVAAEDADFLTNPGVDLRGIVRAIYLNREGQVVWRLDDHAAACAQRPAAGRRAQPANLPPQSA